MPEGPSIYILKELLQPFTGKKIINALGNAKIDMALIKGMKIVELKTGGKQFFIILEGITVRIHLLMFGSYSIDEQTKPDKQLRLCLQFKNEAIYFYTCSVKIVADPTASYDWSADVMSNAWNKTAAIKKLKAQPQTMVCDALLDQEIFSGVGNIIKNEVLYRIKVHPESIIGHMPPPKIRALVEEARNYSFDFLEWKRNFVLKKHWLAHTKKICLRCDLPIIKRYCGKTQRRSFYCENCQVLYK